MIRGKTTKIKKEVKCNIHNRFDIEVKDARTGEIKVKAFAEDGIFGENIVLNALWTRLFTPTTYFNNIHYGTGTGTLDPARTSLFTFLGAKTASNKLITRNESEGYVSSRKNCVIDATLGDSGLVGQILTEVGIGFSATSTNLVTHAPLQDMNGNGISIEIGAFDIITIYATVFVHWDVDGYDLGYGMQDKIKSITVFRSNFFDTYLVGDYSAGAGVINRVGFWGGNAIAQNFALTGNVNNHHRIETIAPVYDIPNKKIKLNSSLRLASTSANFRGLRIVSLMATHAGSTLRHSPAIEFQVGGEWYKKTSITGESIGTGDGMETEFETTFPFVLPGAKIYVNSVEQTSGVSVVEGIPNSQGFNVERYFKILEVSNDLVSYLMRSESNRTLEDGVIFENPFFDKGLLTFVGSYCRLSVSDDLVNWTQVAVGGSSAITVTIPSGSRNKKYWRITGWTSSPFSMVCNSFIPATWFTHNIKFDTPPAIGAVITADYDTETIAKDENHVFDFDFEITLGERV